jgi:predicted RNA polymerase sigma factor
MQDTDWPRIASLYAALAQVAPSPVVALNRAVAVGKAQGADAGLAIVDALAGVVQLRGYAPLHAVRGDLLEQLGRTQDAGREFAKAADLTGNTREREVLLARAAACA